MQLPIDTSELSFICAGPAKAVVDFQTKRPKTDGTGTALYAVPLVAMTDGNAEVIAVKVPGEPKGLTQGAAVRLTGLVAVPYTIGENSGVAYRAARIDNAARPEAKVGS